MLNLEYTMLQWNIVTIFKYVRIVTCSRGPLVLMRVTSGVGWEVERRTILSVQETIFQLGSPRMERALGHSLEHPSLPGFKQSLIFTVENVEEGIKVSASCSDKMIFRALPILRSHVSKT